MNPTDLTVTGHMVNGDLASLSMQVSYDPKTGKSDHIDYDQHGALWVNGQEVQPPLVTDNGTRISGVGKNITLETAGGDRFTFRAPDCGVAGINMDGDVAANRGQGNVDSYFFGKFDDQEAGTAELRALRHYEDDGKSPSSAPVPAAGAAGATNVRPEAVLDDPFREVREAFAQLRDPALTTPPPAAAGVLARIKTPELRQATLDNARSGGTIDLEVMFRAVHDPDEQAKVRRAWEVGKASLEDIVKFISQPAEKRAFVATLVGSAQADAMLAKIR